ncbi:bromodomain-containing protein 4 isoform X2 [Topomyia yanbarensis]|uniref:bromodomain-containing protein 4 isoform X2 n=1 Tax=Topomyia yanbarensis TaxID=2498891 RepID=UPI00273C108E|nr:bromodomain-containing protein 4 isoform X2 [Topomyia yanbarensis]
MINFNWFGSAICLISLLALYLSTVTGQALGGFPAQHSITKRMDLETCLVHFDIHLNTIIRTEESRSMGAKFLDDADVSSREQCLRLCCETENCDVFVFEEKNQGTCFLFQCGPPTDFHCKFTRHSNYTSAVLKIPSVEPPPPALVNQIHSVVQPPQVSSLPKLSQHELELVNLKAPKSALRSDLTTTTLLPPLGVQLGQLPTTTTARPITPSQCGHYEFPCHSGECIAVYNACDGIPQCADGSDEGPECRRPPPVKPFQPVQIPASDGQMNPMPLSNTPIFPADLQQQQLRGLQQQQEEQKMAHQMPHNREDPMTAPKAWPRPLVNSQGSYVDTADSRIFNHKGGLQLASNQNSPLQYQDSLPDTSYVPNIPRNSPYLPLQAQEQYIQPPPQHQPDPVQPPPQPAQILPPQQQLPQQQQTAPVNPNSTGDQSKPITANIEAPKKSPETHKSASKISEEYDSDEDQYQDGKSSNEYQEEEKPDPPQKKKQRKHHKQQHGEEHKKKNKSKTTKKDKATGHEGSDHAAPVHEHLKMLRNDLEIEFADHDGLAERPGGAVLSLTLGAILTAALAILIGCRMKVARRRIRRQGKSSYAHDADFLVNGMYL